MALERTAAVLVVIVHHAGRSGIVELPSLIAAIVGKWRAYAEIPVHERDRDRHVQDTARLLTIVDPDLVKPTAGQRRYLRRLLAEIQARPGMASADGDLVIDTVALLVAP